VIDNLIIMYIIWIIKARNLKWLFLFPGLGCALVIILATLSVRSAPIMNSPNKTDDMKWVNPCGVSTKLRTNGSNPDIAQLEDHDLLNQIVLQARTALKHAQLFRDEFVSNIEYICFSLCTLSHTLSSSSRVLTAYLFFVYINTIHVNTKLIRYFIENYEYQLFNNYLYDFLEEIG